MSDNFEFDDNDDILLNAFCTPPNNNTSQEKRLNEGNNENLPIKKPKLNESTSPIIQFLHKCENYSNESNHSKSIARSSAGKRIFPGPAGILLDENQSEILSQETSSFFQSSPWEEMSKDVKISNSYLYDKFNIAWIKKEATANKFVHQKAPFLVGILVTLEASDGHTQKSINITLKDVTGTIQGTILQNLYEEYASHLILGSVLVLTQFGVLSCTCDKCHNNHHVTITQKNLSAIYTGKEKIVIKQLHPDEILKEYYQKKIASEKVEISKKSIREVKSDHVISNTSSNRCSTVGNTNLRMRFQSSCTNRSTLSPNVLNRTTSNLENTLQRNSEVFLLPKLHTITKTVSETSVISEQNNLSDRLTNLGTCNYSPTPKKLFSFRKVNTSQELPTSPINICSASAINDNSVSSKNNNTKYLIPDNISNTSKDANSFRREESQLSVKFDKEEHEQIWKDVLGDEDVNYLFDEDF